MKELVRTSGLVGLGLAVRFAVGLLVNKAIAVAAGPVGIAAYAQLGNLQMLGVGVAGAPGQNGVVRLTATHRNDRGELTAYWSSALVLVLFGAAVIVVAGLLAAPWIASELAGDHSLTGPIRALVLMLPFSIAGVLLMSCANGLGDVRTMTLAGIAGALVGGMAVAAGVFVAGIKGAVWGMAAGQLLAFAAACVVLGRTPWFRPHDFVASFGRRHLRTIAALSTMAVVAAAAGPTVQLFVRSHIADSVGWAAAGQWQSVAKLGELYFSSVTALLAVYFLPRFSAAAGPQAIWVEISLFGRLVLPIFLAGYAVLVYFGERLIITVYSEEFVAAAWMLPAQMVADVSRLFAWLAGFLVIGRGGPALFVVAELAGSAATMVLTTVAVPLVGEVGAQYAATVTCLLYSAGLFYALRKKGLI